jgi:hypothetical protein
MMECRWEGQPLAEVDRIDAELRAQGFTAEEMDDITATVTRESRSIDSGDGGPR